MPQQHYHPDPGIKVRLSEYATRYEGALDKKQARAEEAKLEEKMASLQERLYAEGKQSLLIVLQSLDAGGKDGTIKHVFNAANPQGIRVANFKVPVGDELTHDFLWRIHQHTPPKGYIAIFNRSHYEDVLVVRVNELAPKSVWQKHYDHINNFERLLFDNGTRILKFFLYISKEEQRERFQERLDRPDKNWKFSTGDLTVRERWDEYMEAYEDVLTRCNTEYAPWHVIPADRKWYRNYVITKAIVETLEAMDPQYPPAEPGLDKVVIPD